MLAGGVAFPLGLEAAPVPVVADAQRTVVDPATSMPIPVEMDACGVRLRLVGYGVRAVTFLRLHVYVAALYVEENALSGIEKAHAAAGDGACGLEMSMQRWLQDSVVCAVRIVPVRGTDFAHIRDGLVRAVQARAKDARAGRDALEPLTPELENGLAEDIKGLKSAFPRAKMGRGHQLDLVVQRVGSASPATYALMLLANGNVLGRIESTSADVETEGSSETKRGFTLPVNILLAYCGERPDISAALRASVREHLERGLP
ncbi:hypothetical protein MSPP1_002194 [Malassezia sp. CBS 17886]|nr:hypothetical protein MSPP1_002194 [Malassezia sp. CBS 17886]